MTTVHNTYYRRLCEDESAAAAAVVPRSFARPTFTLRLSNIWLMHHRMLGDIIVKMHMCSDVPKTHRLNCELAGRGLYLGFTDDKFPDARTSVGADVESLCVDIAPRWKSIHECIAVLI